MTNSKSLGTSPPPKKKTVLFSEIERALDKKVLSLFFQGFNKIM
jgi:hypothetical protein